jgi:hypothetical protein
VAQQTCVVEERVSCQVDGEQRVALEFEGGLLGGPFGQADRRPRSGPDAHLPAGQNGKRPTRVGSSFDGELRLHGSSGHQCAARESKAPGADHAEPSIADAWSEDGSEPNLQGSASEALTSSLALGQRLHLLPVGRGDEMTRQIQCASILLLLTLAGCSDRKRDGDVVPATGASTSAPAAAPTDRYSGFTHALFAASHVHVRGGTVDAHNTAVEPFPGARSAAGHVGSNGTALIEGDILGNVETTGETVVDFGSVAGALIQGAAPRPLPDPAPAIARFKGQNDNARIQQFFAGDVLDIQDLDDIVLPAGNYYCRRLVATGGGLTISTAGRVVIYVAEDVYVGGGGLTMGGATASDLVIVCGGQTVNISGGDATVTLAVYAPLAKVELSGGGFSLRGSVVGNEVIVFGEFSYDQALLDRRLPLLWD